MKEIVFLTEDELEWGLLIQVTQQMVIFFIRTANSAQKLNAKEAVNYISKH